jgi:outer membrane protein, heavy metal efflux system
VTINFRLVLLFFPLLSTAQAQTLTLDDVMGSVKRNYPPLLAALEELPLADADLLQAEGQFDLVVRSRYDSDSLGYYPNRRWDFGVEQPTTFQGMSLLGGYRIGEGSYAPYDGKLDTRSGGEWRTGLRLPLFRDRAIDRRRADLSKASLGRQIARLSVQQQRLAITFFASRRYWDWVAAGRRFRLAQAVLKIAENRQTFLDESVKGGLLPAIDAADNRRAVLLRKGQVVEAERVLQQAAIELSLFYRDTRGSSVLPRPEQLPEGFPSATRLSDSQVHEDTMSAQRQRPEVPRLEAQREQVQVDAEHARNQQLPAIDMVAGFTSESGDGVVRRGPQEFKVGLSFELPWQRRSATGRLGAAEARSRQIRQREQFARDQVQAEVQDAASAVQTAFQRMQVAADEVTVSRELEDAERTRFELGEGTLFQLNLREMATLESAQRDIAAKADYHRAFAGYNAAIGIEP